MPRLYDLHLDQAARRWSTRDLRLEVDERIDAEGEVVRRWTRASRRAPSRRCWREGVEAIAVCLLHSYANPRTSGDYGRPSRQVAPVVSRSRVSSDVLPEIQEYERTSTTVINAYVRPVVERYLGSLSRRAGGARR